MTNYPYHFLKKSPYHPRLSAKASSCLASVAYQVSNVAIPLFPNQNPIKIKTDRQAGFIEANDSA